MQAFLCQAIEAPFNSATLEVYPALHIAQMYYILQSLKKETIFEWSTHLSKWLKLK